MSNDAKSAPTGAAPLIPAVYLLKTVYKKEKQLCHSQTKCSYYILFKVRGRSNVKGQINALVASQLY